MSVLDDKEDTPLLQLPVTGAPPSEAKPLAAAEGGKGPHALLGMACVAASALSFSLMTTCIKYDTYSMTSMEAVFWRSFAAFLLNFGMVLYRGENLHVRPEQRRMLVYRCIVGFSATAFGFYAVSQMVMADASAIKFISPILTFFFGACILKERIDPPSLLCACLAFIGIMCVVRPAFIFGASDSVAAATGGSWMPVAAAMLAAVSQSLVFVTVRQLKSLHVFVIVHYFLLFVSVVSMLIIVLFERSEFMIPSTPQLWAVIVACGVFTFMGQLFLTKGLQLEKAGVASAMRYLDVVFVFIWDAVLIHERISHWSVLGAFIISLSAVVIALRKAHAATA